MNHRFHIEIGSGYVGEVTDLLELGRHFLFVGDGKILRAKGRVGRLTASSLAGRRVVVPVTDEAVEAIRGLTITPRDRRIEPLACLVSDRDLYRAEQDAVHLFIAMPNPPEDIRLMVEMNGAPLTERPLDLGAHGVAVETLAMLLSGRYRAWLRTDTTDLTASVDFTVAEYTLAPLNGRLLAHRIDRGAGTLHFELAVESYGEPCEEALRVALVEAGTELARVDLVPAQPGRYAGRIALAGEGALRLRLDVPLDPSRVAEVAIPGSRARERELSVISELGRQVFFSLMPETGALPLRGGYLSRGDAIAAPLTAEEIVTERGRIHVQADVEGLVAIRLDLATGRYHTLEPGDLEAGGLLDFETGSSASMVFLGCFVNGMPFEGYTTFLQPSRLELSVAAPEEARPGEELVLELTCTGGAETVPVLLSVRDERLTAADTPQSALAASIKRDIDAAVEGMDDDTPFVPLREAELTYPADLYAETMMAGALLEEAVPASAPGDLPRMRLASADLEERMVFRLAEEAEPEGEIPEEAVPDEAKPPCEPQASDARKSFPEVLFFDLIPVSGRERVRIPLSDRLGRFTIETFAMSAGDWAETRSTVHVDKPVRVDLELPPAIDERDRVLGRLRAVSPSGQNRVHLFRDDQPIGLLLPDGRTLSEPEHHKGALELTFEAGPGQYRATVEDAVSGERDAMERFVGEPGRFRSMVRQVAILSQGEAITLETAEALTLRVLPNLDEPFKTLVRATADYAHLCCEQTAAKIIAATVMYLSGTEAADQSRARDIILAGIARERTMWQRGKGFAMYPDSAGVDTYYGPMATGHLWSLSRLQALPDLDRRLKEAVQDGLAMADDTGRAYGLQRIPETLSNARDAYTVASEGPSSRQRSVRDYFAARLDLDAPEPKPKHGKDRVSDRLLAAYAAASLLRLGDTLRGVRLANHVTRQLNAQGRLYSTLDSVAAMALMIELGRSGILAGRRKLRANGREMSDVEALSLADQIETLEVLEGVALVESTRIVEEDWNALGSDLPVKVGLERPDGRPVDGLRPGERVALAVALPQGYETGDLLHVSLPACMSWIHGGAKVKRLSLDFEGRDALRVPLVVTERFQGTQHYAVCVRNMFKEERATAVSDRTVTSAR